MRLSLVYIITSVAKTYWIIQHMHYTRRYKCAAPHGYIWQLQQTCSLIRKMKMSSVITLLIKVLLNIESFYYRWVNRFLQDQAIWFIVLFIITATWTIKYLHWLTSFAWQHVITVLSSPPLKHFKVPVTTPDWKRHRHDSITWLDQHQQSFDRFSRSSNVPGIYFIRFVYMSSAARS